MYPNKTYSSAQKKQSCTKKSRTETDIKAQIIDLSLKRKIIEKKWTSTKSFNQRPTIVWTGIAAMAQIIYSESLLGSGAAYVFVNHLLVFCSKIPPSSHCDGICNALCLLTKE